MDRIIIHEKPFVSYIEPEKIGARVDELAAQISEEYADKNPLFIAVLNGAFIFASDLVRGITCECEITFMKIKSYDGMNSTGEGKMLVGLGEEVTGRHVIVLEDIIDSGNTIKQILPQIESMNPASVKVASLLFKPDAMQYDYHPDYTGFDIQNKFIVGYGLDYSGMGRHKKGLYILEE